MEKWEIQENHEYYSDEKLIEVVKSYKDMPEGIVPPHALLESIVKRFIDMVEGNKEE
jgi:hypothetical protein